MKRLGSPCFRIAASAWSTRSSPAVCRTTSRSPSRPSATAVTREDQLLGADRLVEGLLDLAVRDHLAADLGEPGEPPGDLHEPVFINQAEVAGHVPAVAESLPGQVVPVQVALHHVGALDQDHPFRVRGKGLDCAEADERLRSRRRSRAGTTRTETPGKGWPTVPRREPAWKNPGARKSSALTATTGEHSVIP